MRFLIWLLMVLSAAYFGLAVASIALDFSFVAIAWTGLILICAWAWVDTRKGQHAYCARVV